MLPDWDWWGHKFLLASFDNDPAAEVDALQRVPNAARTKVRTRYNNVWDRTYQVPTTHCHLLLHKSRRFIVICHGSGVCFGLCVPRRAHKGEERRVGDCV